MPAHPSGDARDGDHRWIRAERACATADLRLRDVAVGVLAQAWPLQALTATLLLAAAGWYAGTGDGGLLRAAGRLELLAAVGVGAAFALHEVAHAAVLRRCDGVSHVLVSATAWRFSLEPRGTITPREVVAVAVAGPGANLVAGLLLWPAAPQTGLHWWFLAHLVFLLPCFGDGRSLLVGLSRWRRADAAPRRTTGSLAGR